MINFDPLATEGLIDDDSPNHNLAVNGLPHEMAHLRQIASVLASVLQREGGAQAFADIEAVPGAQAARIPYTPGNFDGEYAAYVKAVQSPPYGPGWITGGHFGR